MKLTSIAQELYDQLIAESADHYTCNDYSKAKANAELITRYNSTPTVKVRAIVVPTPNNNTWTVIINHHPIRTTMNTDTYDTHMIQTLEKLSMKETDTDVREVFETAIALLRTHALDADHPLTIN